MNVDEARKLCKKYEDKLNASKDTRIRNVRKEIDAIIEQQAREGWNYIYWNRLMYPANAHELNEQEFAEVCQHYRDAGFEVKHGSIVSWAPKVPWTTKVKNFFLRLFTDEI